VIGLEVTHDRSAGRLGRCVNGTQGQLRGGRYNDVVMHPPAPILAALIAMALGSGCSSCASYRRCSPPPAEPLRALPTRLSEAGLFADIASGTPSARVRAYAPAFPLWSDGADKRRWLELPASTHIDTSDPNDWVFPVGTRFYKEFARDGRRLETRLLLKWGPEAGDWTGSAYIWLDDQSDAVLAPEGARDVDQRGYDVPSAAECGACHGGRRSHVLGFSALQLGAAKGLPLSLDELVREGLLSAAPETPILIPGDETERRALGYLHANCGHCHNARRPDRDGPRCYDPQRELDLSLPLASGARAAPAYRTAVPEWVTPGKPDQSRLLQLLARRGRRLHMPPLATERPDPEGIAWVEAWIAGLRKVRP